MPATLPSSFPSDGFSENLSVLPQINYGVIWRYMIETCDAKKQLSTAKPMVKGFNFFKSGHVLSIKCQKLNDHFFVKSQVLPSMKKSKAYNCFIVMDALGQVVKAYDECPAGIDGRCNHVAATLFALEHYFKFKAIGADTISCTSKPCQWNIPRKRKIDNVPISHCKFMKHVHGKTKIEKEPPPSEPAHAQAASAEHEFLNNTKLCNYLHMVKETELKTGKKIGLSLLLPQKTEKETVTALLHDHDYTSMDSSLVQSDMSLFSFQISPIKVHPASLDDICTKANQIKQRLFLSQNEITELERKTKGQSETDKWNLHRKYRITASKCHRVATLKESTSPTKAVQEILQYKQQCQTSKMKEGLRREKEIINEYISLQKQKGKDIQVVPSGLVVSATHGFLAASPDGIVTDPSEIPSEGLVEVKLIFLDCNETLLDCAKRKHIVVLDKESPLGIAINKQHKYYYQVQQQMFTSNKEWTVFLIKGASELPDKTFKLGNDILAVKVTFDAEFWSPVLNKLDSFFAKYVTTELAYPRIKYGLQRLRLP